MIWMIAGVVFLSVVIWANLTDVPPWDEWD